MTFKLRLPLAFMAGLFLSGCAITDEFSRQGGFTDRVLDTILFQAEAREHRVFRSYLLVGILARIGSESPVNLDDREAVGFRIKQAVQAAKEALICARDQDCAFFEDRQAILDRRLFRLAVAVLYPEEARDLLVKVRNGLQGKVPLAGRTLAAAAAAVEAVGEAGGAVNEAAGIVSSLLDLGYAAAQYSQRLGPLYRDSLDLDMRIFISSVADVARMRDLECKLPLGSKKARRKLMVSQAAITIPLDGADICQLQFRALQVHGEGIGSVAGWRSFLNNEVKPYAVIMKPQPAHWGQASDLIWRGCRLLLKEEKIESECQPSGSLIYESLLNGERRQAVELEIQ